MNAGEIGLLASVGVLEVNIYKAPRVGLISTGDEIVPAETKEIKRGEVRDSNKLMFKSLLIGMGVNTVQDFGSVSDDKVEVAKTIF